MLRRFLPMFVILWLPAATGWALDPARHITQYAHSAWRMEDGSFNSTPSTIVWIGTADGVMQFDGVHFVRWTPGHGQRLPNSEVLRLGTTRDGSVWISALGFLSRWKGHTLTNYATGSRGPPSAVVEDNDGTFWLGQSYPPEGTGPICQVRDPGLRCLGPGDGIPSFNARAILADRDGTLWIGGDTLLLHWAQGAPTVYRLPGLAENRGIPGITAIAPSADGGVWVGVGKAGPGLGLQRLTDGRWHSFDTPAFHGSSVEVTALYADREGALWVGTYDHGIYRIHGSVVDHIDRTNGLSGDVVHNIAEDREGNLWVVTQRGVDRFADTPVTSVSGGEGLCSIEASSVLASRDGSIWTGGDGALTRLHDGGVTCFRSGRELPGSQVTSLFEDHAGRLWVGLDQGLWVYEGGRFLQVTRPDARPLGLVTGIAQDAAQRIWIAAAGPPRILMRVEGLMAREDVLEPLMPRRIAPDPTGGLWLGLFNGDLAHFGDGQTVVHAFQHPGVAVIDQLLPEADGSVLAATNYGLMGEREAIDADPEQRAAVRAGLCHGLRPCGRPLAVHELRTGRADQRRPPSLEAEPRYRGHHTNLRRARRRQALSCVVRGKRAIARWPLVVRQQFVPAGHRSGTSRAKHRAAAGVHRTGRRGPHGLFGSGHVATPSTQSRFGDRLRRPQLCRAAESALPLPPGWSRRRMAGGGDTPPGVLQRPPPRAVSFPGNRL